MQKYRRKRFGKKKKEAKRAAAKARQAAWGGCYERFDSEEDEKIIYKAINEQGKGYEGH